jgi:hypothetical protein
MSEPWMPLPMLWTFGWWIALHSLLNMMIEGMLVLFDELVVWFYYYIRNLGYKHWQQLKAIRNCDISQMSENMRYINFHSSSWKDFRQPKLKRVQIHHGVIICSKWMGMKLRNNIPGQVSIDVTDYVKHVLEGFPKAQVEKSSKSPWSDIVNLYTIKL